MFIINVMLSPFRRIRPNAFLVFFLIDNSSASSNTTFMYSSKPCARGRARRERAALLQGLAMTLHGTRLQTTGREPPPGGDCVHGTAHNDTTLDSKVGVLIQPDLHPRFLRRRGIQHRISGVQAAQCDGRARHREGSSTAHERQRTASRRSRQGKGPWQRRTGSGPPSALHSHSTQGAQLLRRPLRGASSGRAAAHILQEPEDQVLWRAGDGREGRVSTTVAPGGSAEG